MLVRLNKGIRCKTGTRRADPSCCKHGADFLSAKAGHWGNLRRREAAWTEVRTCQSEDLQTVRKRAA